MENQLKLVAKSYDKAIELGLRGVLICMTIYRNGLPETPIILYLKKPERKAWPQIAEAERSGRRSAPAAMSLD